MIGNNAPVWFGGDYNPEQWPEEVWADDVRLMQRAGVTIATVGVFSWAKLEPRDGEFDFAWLDRVIDGLHAGGVKVDLATATASPPPWLSAAHPEILPVTAEGVRLGVGSRQQYSPSSQVYRQYATRFVRALAERYGAHPAIAAWHINNEYGCHVAQSFDDDSAAAFRVWLEARYGSIEALNHAWGTAFWSQHYARFSEVEPPRAMPSFPNPTQVLDFHRFSSDALLECYRAELAVLREVTPDIPVTTNFMGFFKPVDYWTWAKEVDFVSDDSYPDPADPLSPAFAAMTRDLMRSLRGGQPWMLMEQTTGAVNWRTRNAPKLPGENRLYSMQSIARGADGILYFQWRQSVAGAEKFHAAMVPHAGEDTRIFREVTALGAELSTMGDVVGSRVASSVAIVFDWDSWNALEQAASPAQLVYLDEIMSWHWSLRALGVTVDFVEPGASVDGYSLVIAPALFAVPRSALETLAAVPARGGQLIVGYQTGILDENLHVQQGGYLGPLQAALGVRVEEFAPLAGPDLRGTGTAPVPTTAIRFGDTVRAASVWTELLHADDAEVLATFTEGLAEGSPAITRRSASGPASGSDAPDAAGGTAWYVATRPDTATVYELLLDALGRAGIRPLLDGKNPDVEVVERAGTRWVLNFGRAEATVTVGEDTVTIAAHDLVRLPVA